MSDTLEEPLSYLESNIYQTYLQQYFSVGVISLLVYDAVINFHKEIKFFWRSPKSLSSAIYFVNRYSGIVGAIANITSKFSYWISSLSNWLSMAVIDYILLLRVLAICHNEFKMAVFLRVLFVMEIVFTFFVLIYGNVLESFSSSVVTDQMTACFAFGDLPSVVTLLDIMSWVSPTAYGLVLLVLALYKSASYYHRSQGISGMGLVQVLIGDQAFYFTLVITCSILEIIANLLRDSSSTAALFLASIGNPSFMSVLGCYILIHLKEVAEQGVNGGTSCKETMGSMSFADNNVNTDSERGVLST